MVYPARRRVSTMRQLKTLVEYMETHQPLAMARIRTKEVRHAKGKMWKDLTTVLNRQGPPRTTGEWPKFWNELKHKVKNRAIKIKVGQRQSIQSGKPYTGPDLTPLEERVLKIICPDVNLLDAKRDIERRILYSDDDTNDNDNQDDQDDTPTENPSDFFQVKIQENESNSDSDSSSENPLNHNSVSPTLKEMEPPALPSPVHRRSSEEVKKRRKSKNSRQISRKFKRRETVNEFDVFSKHVASQLKLLPPAVAIQAQADIQNILTRLRLANIKNDGSNGSGREQEQYLEFIETYYEDGDDLMNGSKCNED